MRRSVCAFSARSGRHAMSRKASPSAGKAADCFTSTTLLHHSPQNGCHTQGGGLVRLDGAAEDGERGRGRQCRRWSPRLPGGPLPPPPPPKSPPCTRTAVPCRLASLGMHCARMYRMNRERACNPCIAVRIQTWMLNPNTTSLAPKMLGLQIGEFRSTQSIVFVVNMH